MASNERAFNAFYFHLLLIGIQLSTVNRVLQK
jgi:hypothetical protein